ncbi:MAG: 50S ribosomal protein L17 [Deltaproteobacteria bacterium]|nr:50S ribosomal protein L17 [Deltaproteobacteria bacterium]
MRHLKDEAGLGVSPSHRKAMLRNMVTSLLENERIQTTVVRAKALRRVAEKMITLGKKGDLNARRRALATVRSKPAMANLFGDLAERFASRKGGYTRILKAGNRKGDNAQLAYVVLVDGPRDPMTDKTVEPKKETKAKASKPQPGKKDQKEKKEKKAPAAKASAKDAGDKKKSSKPKAKAK